VGSFSPPLERVNISAHSRQGVVLSTLHHEREAESSLILSRLSLLVLLSVDLGLEERVRQKVDRRGGRGNSSRSSRGRWRGSDMRCGGSTLGACDLEVFLKKLCLGSILKDKREEQMSLRRNRGTCQQREKSDKSLPRKVCAAACPR